MIYQTGGEPANHHTIDLFIVHITEIHRTMEWCPCASWVNTSCKINSPVIYWGSYCLIFSILCSIASTIVRLFMILLMAIILSAFPRITTAVLNIFTASVLNTPLICSTCHKHFPVLSSFMIKNCFPFRSSPPCSSEFRVTRSLILCVCFVCPFVLFLLTMFFFDLRILVTPLVSTNSCFKLFLYDVRPLSGLILSVLIMTQCIFSEWPLGKFINTTIRLYMSSVRYLYLVVSNSTWLYE
jgi:hypothetical protein